MNDEKNIPLVPRSGYRAGVDGRSVPLGKPERVGHRAVNHDDESDGNSSETSGASELDLTDSSSDDEDGVQGGRVKRIVMNIEKMRRVRRRSLPMAHELSDSEGPPGLNPSSDDNCPASDELESDTESDKIEVRTGQVQRRRSAAQRSRTWENDQENHALGT